MNPFGFGDLLNFPLAPHEAYISDLNIISQKQLDCFGICYTYSYFVQQHYNHFGDS